MLKGTLVAEFNSEIILDVRGNGVSGFVVVVVVVVVIFKKDVF